MKRIFTIIFIYFIGTSVFADELIFEEVDGLVAVEAEHFVDQTKTTHRQWYVLSDTSQPNIKPDADGSHHKTASGGAYLEILPDTRRTHSDPLVNGQSFSNTPGVVAILSYKVYFNNPGKYYVWVRAHSTGTEDNGIHVGLDGKWPSSGQRMQWCDGKQKWYWESKQRTDANHCGERYKIYIDVKTAGLHTVNFSMREDGFEFDKFIMTTDRRFARPGDAGPEERLYTATGIESHTESIQPKIFQLYQNFPNPFNPTTAISYELKTASYVNLVIANIHGQIVKEFNNGFQQAGTQHVIWNGKNESNFNVPSGLYLYTLFVENSLGSFSQQRKMLMIK